MVVGKVKDVLRLESSCVAVSELVEVPLPRSPEAEVRKRGLELEPHLPRYLVLQYQLWKAHLA